MSFEWVDFELGTDIRNETRLIQDQQWSNAVADGRVHLSHREMAMLHAPQLCLAIDDYKLIVCYYYIIKLSYDIHYVYVTISNILSRMNY